MVPYLLLQCLLLSYISGNVSAQFFASLFRGLSRIGPEVMEMKPLEFESPVLTSNKDFNFDADIYKSLQSDKDIESDLSALWSQDQKVGLKAMETNLGGSENKGDILPDKNEKGSDPSGTNKDEVNEKTQDKGKKDDDNHHHHPHHHHDDDDDHHHFHLPHDEDDKEDKDDNDSPKTKSHNNNEVTFLSTIIRKADKQPYIVKTPLHQFAFYMIIITYVVSIITIMYISFKKCRKPKQSDDSEPIML